MKFSSKKLNNTGELGEPSMHAYCQRKAPLGLHSSTKKRSKMWTKRSSNRPLELREEARRGLIAPYRNQPAARCFVKAVDSGVAMETMTISAS